MSMQSPKGTTQGPKLIFYCMNRCVCFEMCTSQLDAGTGTITLFIRICLNPWIPAKKSGAKTTHHTHCFHTRLAFKVNRYPCIFISR
jgi:hypothetical protein